MSFGLGRKRTPIGPTWAAFFEWIREIMSMSSAINTWKVKDTHMSTWSHVAQGSKAPRSQVLLCWANMWCHMGERGAEWSMHWRKRQVWRGEGILATRDHVWVFDPNAATVFVDVCGFYFYQRMYRYTGVMMPLGPDRSKCPMQPWWLLGPTCSQELCLGP